MRQKTFKVSNLRLDFVPRVGQEVILIGRENVMRGGEEFTIINALEGIGGNMDSNVKRFHGWRGTTNDIALYAHGLRKITKVESVDLGADYGYKITVGKDLHPDWD